VALARQGGCRPSSAKQQRVGYAQPAWAENDSVGVLLLVASLARCGTAGIHFPSHYYFLRPPDSVAAGSSVPYIPHRRAVLSVYPI